MKVINGSDLYYSIRQGADEVEKHRIHMNKINVFPVADGDTGNNMTSTFKGIVEHMKLSKNASEVMLSVADGALLGARGNSGIIFAQFMNGLYMQIRGKEELSIDEFVDSINGAVPYAYRAIEKPVEGTILTVMKGWAEALRKYHKQDAAPLNFMERAFADAEMILEETKETLEVLKVNKVVDSGARGFVYFIKGILAYFKGEHVEYSVDEDMYTEQDHNHNHNHTGDIPYRYCTEGLIEGENLDIGAIKAIMKELGDSVIVAGHQSRVRVHVHTNTPDELFYRLRAFGTLLQQKVDDMKIQSLVFQERRHPIGIVTDSICDMPVDMIEQHQIHMIPMSITIDGSEYLDKMTITSKQCYDYYDKAKEFPTTSLPSIQKIEQKLKHLLSFYDELIIMMVSSELSGTYNVMSKVIDSLEEKERISLIDTKVNSGAQGLLVLEAARLLDKGWNRFSTVEWIEKAIPKTRIYVSVDTLENMVKGGRVPQVLGVFGRLINLKPIVTLDKTGKGAAFGAAFSYHQNRRRLLNIIRKQMIDGLVDYVIVHGNSQKRAIEMAKLCEQITSKPPAFISEVSPAVGLSAGRGSVAIAYIERE